MKEENLISEFSQLTNNFEEQIINVKTIEKIIDNNEIQNNQKKVDFLIDSLYPLLQKTLIENNRNIENKHPKFLPRFFKSH